MKNTCKLLMILAALFALTAFAGCKGSETSAEDKHAANRIKTVKVSVVTIAPVPIRDILVLPGETEAWQDVRVSADASGQVEWIGPKEGDLVRKEQLIAKIDVSSLKASLDRAKAAYDLADAVYKRRKQLFDRKIINQEELDRTLTERILAEANLRQAQVEYNRGFLKAPVRGMVNHLFVDQGEFIDRGKPVADLVNVDRIKINVNVPELDVRYLRVGQEASVRIDAFPGRRLQGKVDFVAYKANPATKTFPVRVVIDNPAHEIRPGMIARVAFLRRVIPDALVAPLFALVDKGGERLVYVEKEGVVQARTVSIGVIEGDRVQITKGLKVGDHLIVVGQSEVEEGMRVQVQ